MDGTVNLGADEDLPFNEQADIRACGHYAAASEELAQDMQDAAAAPPSGLFVPREDCLYIKRLVKGESEMV